MNNHIKTNSTLKVASVGLGWVATHRHLPIMLKNKNFSVVGVIDRRNGHAKNISKKFNINNYYQSDSLAKVDWIDEVQAITVTTPPQEHYAIIKEALMLGKHVLTEKPFVMNRDEGGEIIQLAKERKCVLSIVHNFQFSTSFLKLQFLMTSGNLGRIRSIVAHQLSNPERRLPDWYDHLPLGLFYDESPHLFYLLHCLTNGNLKFIKADTIPSSQGLKTPALMDVTYYWHDNNKRIPIKVHLNFESPISEWHICVMGENGICVVDLFRDICIFLPNDKKHTTQTVLRTSIAATLQHWSQHITCGSKHLLGNLYYGNDEVFSRFFNAVVNGEKLLGINDECALSILNMQHQIIDSHKYLY